MERFSQGELTFVKLPDDADMSGKAFADTATDGRWIIGHSETGHHHVMDRAPVQIVERDNAPIGVRILRLIVAEPVACEHLRSFDTHAPVNLSPGKWEVRTAREYDPLAKIARRVAD